MKSSMECNDSDYVQRLAEKDGAADGFVKDGYSPYRSHKAPEDERFSAPPVTRLKRTTKRPFIIPLKLEEKWEGREYYLTNGNIYNQKAVQYRWYIGVGCLIFDGFCISQDDFNKIDCASCVKATFEDFVRGCKHTDTYTDQYGTRRCMRCKDELGQDEPDDPPEMDDHSEDDTPQEPEPLEYGDPEIFLNREDMGHYRSWNLEGKTDQCQVPNDADLDQSPCEDPCIPFDVWHWKTQGLSKYPGKFTVKTGEESHPLSEAVYRLRKKFENKHSHGL